MVDMKQRYLYGYSVSGMLTRSGRWWQFVGCGIGLTIVVLSLVAWVPVFCCLASRLPPHRRLVVSRCARLVSSCWLCLI